jgi:peptidoglycan LD-endopeptidase CwlK
MNERSLTRLNQAHPLLRKLMIEAAEGSPIRFEIGEVARTKVRQQELVAAGASWTMNSRHIPKLPASKEYGGKPLSHAADIVCYVVDKVRWDWPLYSKAAEHIKSVANRLGIAIVWGGDWKVRDGPHFELNHKYFP